MSVQSIPEHFTALTPYLVVDGAAEALAFYKQAFGAKEIFRMASPDGKVGHADLEINGARLMLADEHPEMGALGPRSVGGTPVSLLLYVDKVDEVFQRAVAAGGKELRPVTDQFYGDRMGYLEDPFGHKWSIASHVEDVSAEELERRVQSMQGGNGE